ncbi:carboxylate-amine ligase [Leucobacter denitrificans]|uniref:Putative glutamate--cysteine ligase 2 n=1 Tax=Leucobacter denitrificans TaxID=683042 RepID=A0A7G9S4A2_9MICO|nr:glutamate--cysteine ligase [Leucobacter denitrificans]QNN62677.1 glutamate--cysteine ligase [Leucobacter denitrificans]
MNTTSLGSGLRTVGVEQEFLLVDPLDGRPVAAADFMLSTMGDQPEPTESPSLEREVKQEQIEVTTPPLRTLDEIARSISEARRLADSKALEFGVRAVALGTSVLPSPSHLARSARYAAIRRRFGITLKEQLTCGFHVHVGISSPEEGIAVLDRVRPWLPALLALSSNSPFWNGVDTGFASYRYQAWGRWPTSGPYDVFGSVNEYQRRVRSLIDTGVPLDSGMIYFDARLCDHYPTVEFRVADICTDPEHAVAVTALARALVDVAAQEWANGFQPDPVPTEVLRLAMWSASRFGIREHLLNPLLGEPCDARRAIDALLAHVQSALTSNGDFARTERAVDDIFRRGTGADQQRNTLLRTDSPHAVVTEAIELTHRSAASTALGPNYVR